MKQTLKIVYIAVRFECPQVSYLTFFIFNFDADRQYKDQEKLQQLEDEYQVSLFVEECSNKSIN